MAQACEVQAFSVPDGLTKDQERLLKKKRKQAGSQVDRWKEMYRILFPDDDENDIPEPYDEDDPRMTWEAHRAQEFDQYERYLRRELPRLVRQRLEVAASDISSGPLETELRNRLVDIVRDSQSHLFQLYREL
ncbi:hypothetical protein NEMBOFW57_006769 [Staphylotrichum longicolle]|uniref:Uncharacterized protein n=1 Tax=Staphylotrichum longicolle TaxID=669026 RepID=A0AAD4ETK7_9PEZI|nr:hypothetical protein NEMBOFW57_006769 [Staphylotrichum longicolle]